MGLARGERRRGGEVNEDGNLAFLPEVEEESGRVSEGKSEGRGKERQAI